MNEAKSNIIASVINIAAWVGYVKLKENSRSGRRPDAPGIGQRFHFSTFSPTSALDVGYFFPNARRCGPKYVYPASANNFRIVTPHAHD